MGARVRHDSELPPVISFISFVQSLDGQDISELDLGYRLSFVFHVFTQWVGLEHPLVLPPKCLPACPCISSEEKESKILSAHTAYM